MFGYEPKEVAKAITAFLTAGLGSLGSAYADGAITPEEAVGCVLAAIVAGASVFGIQNTPADPN